MADEPRAHVYRPELPWRTGPARTECGKLAADYALVITRDELSRRLRVDGQTRTLYSTCVTCLQTAERWSEWNKHPSQVLAREFYGGRVYDGMDDELRAIAAIIEAHREEFDQYLRGLASTIRLDDLARARMQQKGRMIRR